MTAKEYQEFEKDFRAFMEREGLHSFCSVRDEDGDVETFFSWRHCECCGTPLGGDREEVEGVPKDRDGEVFTYRVCMDCVYYEGHGRLDDMTMMEVEKDLEDSIVALPEGMAEYIASWIDYEIDEHTDKITAGTYRSIKEQLDLSWMVEQAVSAWNGGAR